MFKSVSENIAEELSSRKNARKGLRSFGISYLDDALLGIGACDLVLLGASSGVGKTQLCCNIAFANISAGKRVHFLALEAEEYEIERRLKYQVIAAMFYADPNRPNISNFSFDRWLLGDFIEPLQEYEDRATEFMVNAYKDFFIFYKTSGFSINDLIENIVRHAPETDLFIIDHAHYFDFDDDNENRAMKTLAKTVRTLALEERKPIILVAHLRKRDKANEDLVPGMDEFHGSSDLTKIATKVITISSGSRLDDGCYETYIRIPKNRTNGTVTRFLGRLSFNPRKNSYDERYKVGRSNLTRKEGFAELDRGLQPEWCNRF
jgi:replicative DNA helicase